MTGKTKSIFEKLAFILVNRSPSHSFVEGMKYALFNEKNRYFVLLHEI